MGLRTSVDVLDAASKLGDAQTREVNALAGYEISLIDAAFATGTVVGGTRVRWDELRARDPGSQMNTGDEGVITPFTGASEGAEMPASEVPAGPASASAPAPVAPAAMAQPAPAAQPSN